MLFVNFSPYSYFFLSVYLLMLSVLLFTPNFFMFWIIMEFMMLLFMGLGYSISLNSFSSLMLFFLLQTFSSFGLLTFYLFNMGFLFTVFFLLKLSMFPFHFWVISVSYRLSNFLIGLSLTVHKLPVFLMTVFFNLHLDSKMVWVSMVFSIFLSGFMMLSTSDLRLALISSSIGNNSWFLLCSLLNLSILSTFFLLYSLLLLTMFSNLGFISKELIHFNTNKSMTMILLISMSGLPPFPMFFMKMLILSTLLMSNMWSFLLLFFLVGSAIMLAGYIQLIFKHIIYEYAHMSSFLLF